jgi:hypothetical protein
MLMELPPQPLRPHPGTRTTNGLGMSFAWMPQQIVEARLLGLAAQGLAPQ